LTFKLLSGPSEVNDKVAVSMSMVIPVILGITVIFELIVFAQPPHFKILNDD